MKKKLLSMTLVLCLVLALLPTAAFAADDGSAVVASGTCGAEGDGSNLTWTLTADGALTISGTGDMMSQFNQVEPVWGRYVRTARIASGVTTIGAGAFHRCAYLTSVELPDTLTAIGVGAFSECKSLSALTIPEGVTTIQRGAFTNCSNLVTLRLPAGLQTLADYTFAGCSKLVMMNIPEGITSVGECLFNWCTSLQTVLLPASLQSVGAVAFDGVPLQAVCYPGTAEQWQAVKLAENQGSKGLANAKVYYGHADHSFADLTASAPTCTDGGAAHGTCSDCGFVLDASFKALDHDWDEGEVLAKPSGIRGGVKQHTCLRCGAPGVEFLMPEILAYEQFGDIDPEDWSYEDIQFCVMTGLMSGTSDTTFSPNGVTTRAQVVQVLYNLMEEPEVSGTTPFTDLTADWYQDAVLWAYQTGVVVGTSDTTFSPEAPVTREQIAVILMEFASKVLQIESGETPADLSAYPDGGSVSDWARTAMADAVALGILSGAQDSNGTLWLQPQAGATRAEVATILEGFCVVIVYAQ